MVQWVMVLMLWTSNYSGGAAFEKIEGYRTKESCQSALNEIPNHPFGGYFRVTGVCIPKDYGR